MKFSYDTRSIASATSVAVTVAVLAKIFVPFYLIGSTAIFAASVALGFILVAISWRPVFDGARLVGGFFTMAAAFYGVVIVSFVAHSRPAVPPTHLAGILIFHTIFLTFGFAAARGLKIVLLVLLGAAAIYAAVLVQHALRFGGLTIGINIDDVFGIGVPAIFVAFHQNIGLILGLGVLATLGLASNRMKRIFALVATAIVLALLFHIAARTALVALASSLIFLGFASLWTYSRKAAFGTLVTLVTLVTIASAVLYQRALDHIDVDAVAPDAISRTIRELQHPNPEFRLPIWERTWRTAVSEPNSLLFGRGVGMYPVDSGFGAPDWLLHPTEGSKHYPHSVHLEILYETGTIGLVLFSIMTIFPVIASLHGWSTFSPSGKSAVTLYVFIFVTSDISGAFAYTYLLQFFLGLTTGVIAVKRTEYANTRDSQIPSTKTLYRRIASNGADI